jgi:palmitoyltransferase ZDHHC9/14/18
VNLALGGLTQCTNCRGKNTFFCDGKVMCGPDWLNLVGSLAFLCIPVGLFLAFPGADLAKNGNLWSPVLGSVIFVFTLYFMLATACRDPGIIPRRPLQPSVSQNRSNLEGDDLNESFFKRRPPRTQDVLVNGKLVRLKYCSTCNFYRPPRTSHCSICDNCVEEFDHHCPYLSNCIGKRNYRSFTWFIYTVLTLNVYVFGCCIFQIVDYAERDSLAGQNRFVETLQHCVVSYLLVLFTFACFWLLAGLCSFHVYLTCIGQTTNEHLKGMFPETSPHSRGFFRNFINLFCQSSSSSRLDLSRQVVRGEDLAKQPVYNVQGVNDQVVPDLEQSNSVSHVNTSVFVAEDDRSASFRDGKLNKEVDEDDEKAPLSPSIPDQGIYPRDRFRFGSRGVSEFEGTEFNT